MSAFWEASDLPCDDISVRQGRLLTAWCEAEVERACREPWTHIDIIDGEIADDGELPVNVFLASDWDAEIGSLSTVSKLIEEAADSFVNGKGIIADPADQERVEKMLRRVEATIAETREHYPAQTRPLSDRII